MSECYAKRAALGGFLLGIATASAAIVTDSFSIHHVLIYGSGFLQGFAVGVILVVPAEVLMVRLPVRVLWALQTRWRARGR